MANETPGLRELLDVKPTRNKRIDAVAGLTLSPVLALLNKKKMRHTQKSVQKALGENYYPGAEDDFNSGRIKTPEDFVNRREVISKRKAEEHKFSEPVLEEARNEWMRMHPGEPIPKYLYGEEDPSFLKSKVGKFFTEFLFGKESEMKKVSTKTEQQRKQTERIGERATNALDADLALKMQQQGFDPRTGIYDKDKAWNQYDYQYGQKLPVGMSGMLSGLAGVNQANASSPSQFPTSGGQQAGMQLGGMLGGLAGTMAGPAWQQYGPGIQQGMGNMYQGAQNLGNRAYQGAGQAGQGIMNLLNRVRGQ